MNALLQKVFPEGYRKLVMLVIVLAIGLGIYLAHGSVPDAVVKLLLGGYAIFAGGNVAEWAARALGDLEAPGGFSAARDEVVNAASSVPVPPVVPQQVAGAVASASRAIVAVTQDQHSALAQRVEQIAGAIGQIMEAQQKQGNTIGGLVQIINGVRRQAAAGPMQSGAAPLNQPAPQSEEG